MEAGSVAVGYIHPGEVDGAFAQSLAMTVLHDRTRNRIQHVINVQSSPRIAEGRSELVDGFLHQTDADWLWMVDADMAWEPGDFEVLCQHADKDRAPIVGGLCFGGGRNFELGMPKVFPTIYKLVEQDGLPATKIVYDYPRDTFVRCSATGAAFLMVHRRVFVRMANHLSKMPDGTHNPYPWFAEVVNKGRAVGEDITFCLRAGALGFPIYVHTGVRIRHHKGIFLTEETYDYMVEKALEEAGPQPEAA